MFRRRKIIRRRSRGMQRIRTVRYPVRNIGGDRCFAKLRYVAGHSFNPEAASSSVTTQFPFNVGCQLAMYSNFPSIYSVFGNTPNLSTLAQMYQQYRIRGIKLRLTAYYVPPSGAPPICLFVTAQGSTTGTMTGGPTPAFPTPSISTTPEQRWSKTRVVANTGNGARPTSLSVYYSVNKVYGPDSVVKGDTQFVGDLQTTSPYWGTVADTGGSVPSLGPWCMFGVYSMDGSNIPTNSGITLRVEATVYSEFFSKRPLTE